MKKPRKITKKRLNEFSQKLIAKVEKAEAMPEILRLHRHLNRVTFILNCHHNEKFQPEKFQTVDLGKVLKRCEKWKNQREMRRFLIMRHPTFFCPVSGQCLDLDRSFIIRGQVFDLAALSKVKRSHLTEIDLEGLGGLL